MFANLAFPSLVLKVFKDFYIMNCNLLAVSDHCNLLTCQLNGIGTDPDQKIAV